jgi:hypothetical protein
LVAQPSKEHHVLKKLVATSVVMAFLCGVVFAAEYEGTVTKIDTEKKVLKVKVKIKDELVEKEFSYSDKDTTFAGKVGRKNKAKDLSPDAITEYLESKAAKKRGLTVKLSTEGDTFKLNSVKTGGKKKKKKSDLE